MKQAIIEALVGAVVVLALVGGSYRLGSTNGANAQKDTDQVQFDRIERERTQQKDEASRLYQQAMDNILALVKERDTLKTNLEKSYAKNRKETGDLADQLAHERLRFRAEQSPGNRTDGGGSAGPGADAPGAPAAPIVELPEKITGDLRRLARDADELRDAYTACYGWINAPEVSR